MFKISVLYLASILPLAIVNGAEAEINPYEGATGFVHGGFTSQVEKSLGQDSSISELAKIVKQQSTAIWLAGDNPDMGLIKEAMGQAKDKPVVMTYVVYNVIQDLYQIIDHAYRFQNEIALLLHPLEVQLISGLTKSILIQLQRVPKETPTRTFDSSLKSNRTLWPI